MKVLKKITNGVLLVVIGILHTKFALSADVFGKQFQAFASSYFYKIHGGMNEMPTATGFPHVEAFAAFWFFYFGILIIPLGLLVHYVESRHKTLPHSFTISYLLVVLIGSYMVPSSGMTYIMLPHAVYMLAGNYIKARKQRLIHNA